LHKLQETEVLHLANTFRTRSIEHHKNKIKVGNTIVSTNQLQMHFNYIKTN